MEVIVGRPGDTAVASDQADPVGVSLLLGWLLGLAAGFALGVVSAMAASSGPGPARRADATSSPLRPLRPGWSGLLGRTLEEFNQDQIPAVAGGAAFFALLSIFPALGAFAAVFTLFADLGEAQRQIASLAGVLPSGAVSILEDEMTRLATQDHGRLGLAFAFSLTASLWASNAGVKALIGGLNIAYEVREHRGLVALNLVSLTFTVGAVLSAVIGAAAIAAVPQMQAMLGLTGLSGVAMLRWPVLLALVVALISLLYRYAPCRPRARWRWITPGSSIAAIGWLAMSLLFSWYVANFGRYDQTYGALGAVVGFMTWIWLSLIVVLFGAELNAEIERRGLNVSPQPPKEASQFWFAGVRAILPPPPDRGKIAAAADAGGHPGAQALALPAASTGRSPAPGG